MEPGEWKKILQVNLNGAYYMGTAMAKYMRSRGKGGKMTFVISTGAYRAGINFGAYSVSKAGVSMLVKTLALELAEDKINVNAIAPTATRTKFTQDYYDANPEICEQVKKNHPLGRLGCVEDYMGGAVYLSSPASDFVTGTVLVIDGGKMAK